MKKAYDALNRESCLDILVVYSAGTQMEGLIRRYWGGLTMVAWVGLYYVAPFKGYKGVTQGNLLSPTIFNMVVNAVIHN